ncbi:unnamed protein product [Cylindrotheca closterium]|uniref:XPG-I domain-containing protein n=1 Tax=Cylindrotheca closterium TaxID=2856 RepID=A0AAD2FJU9_9STRA|nr:unnamed protein product [Cylindrotheca closterium]
MTVSSLWKALGRAGCGKPVGSKELQEHFSFHERTHPWNINDKRSSSNNHCPSLAVDLSIWICEALTCSAFDNCKTDPSLHLVYTRTVKLLSMGIKLVVVIEGKRRQQRQGEGEDSFRKRRTGTRFWNACQRCEQMLQLLGVPVVRAKAEGEALCALLNEKGIVDGVISNDGDCLLYGAKVLYTKFTLENLEKKMVMRYDCSNIRACVDDDDGNEYDNQREPKEIVSLDRSDLIAFAILTGSDAVGAGIPKVGCRKAIRFIKKSQLDNPLKRKDAAMDELKSWARAALVAKANAIAINCIDDDTKPQVNAKHTCCCSCCGHPGTKTKHQKQGCALCCTGPGEPCFALSPGAKFRSAMRKKAMSMEVDFDPESVIRVYQSPNDNQIPLPLLGKTSTTLRMAYPNFQGFQDFTMVIRGQSLSESREYLKQSLSSLMARNELLDTDLRENIIDTATSKKKLPSNKTRPEPRKINKTMVRGGKPAFEVEWIVKATVTDFEGNPMNEFIFATIEDQQMVKRRYPKLLEDFETREKERAKQGDAEQEKRRAFLELLCTGCDPKEESKEKAAEARKVAGRCFREDKRVSFGVSEPANAGKDDDPHVEPIDMEITFLNGHDIKAKSRGKRKRERKQSIWGDDADNLLRYVCTKPKKMTKEDDSSSICTCVSSIATADGKEVGDKEDDSMKSRSLTPGHVHFLGAKRKVKCHIAPKALCLDDSGKDPFGENRQMEVAQPKRRPILSTFCLEQRRTPEKQPAEHSSTSRQSSLVAHSCRDHQIIVRKPRELSIEDNPYIHEKEHDEASPSRSAHYTHDLELRHKEDHFHSRKQQQMNYELRGRNQDFGLNERYNAPQDRREENYWLQSPHHDLNSRHAPPYNADYLMQSPHSSRRPYPPEEISEYEHAAFVANSAFNKYDNSFDTEPCYEVDYIQAVPYSVGLGLSHHHDSNHRKRQKFEFDSLDFNQQLRREEMYDVHQSREGKVSRQTHWENDTYYTHRPQDSRNEDFLVWSTHEEEFEPDHPNMRKYSEYHSYDEPSSWQTKDENLGHSHTGDSSITTPLFPNRFEEASHGMRGSSWPQHPKGSGGGRGSNKALYEGVVQDATEKLKIKIRQATLDMECYRELEGRSWLGY